MEKQGSLSYADQLWAVSRITTPAAARAIRSAGLAAGSRGLDAGCGAGCHVGPLSHVLGPSGRLTALDLSAENLARARAVVAAGRDGSGGGLPVVEFVEGDIRRLPFEDGSFDWVWCADTLWPGAVVDDPLPVVREFLRVTRPGGRVCLFYWSGQMLLPGHQGLEARLNAAFADWAPYIADVPAQAQFLRAAGWLRQAGLRRPRTATFLAEVRPPIDTGMRGSLAVCYGMLWGRLEGRVAAADWEAYRRLCDPASADFIADVPDYYGFVSYTLFWALR